MAKGLYLIVSKLDKSVQVTTATRKPNKTTSKNADVVLFMPTKPDSDVDVLKSNRALNFVKNWRAL